MSERKKILCIDDEPTILKLLVNFLRKQDYEVVAQTNGKEALDWLQNGDLPDLILCDVQMETMDGYEVIQRVRQSGYFRNIPMIMLSGIESSAEHIKCLKLGANDFITKPFNPELLGVKIQIALGRKF